MNTNDNAESVEELIIIICKKVTGVGNATAGAIASDFEGDLQEFLIATHDRLLEVTNSSGRILLSTEQIAQLISESSQLPKGFTIEETWVCFEGREFLKSQVKMVRSLHLEDFDINPLLSKALNLDSAKKVIAFNVYQSVTRSIVTSWGDVIEHIARHVGAKKNDYVIEGKTGTNFDLFKKIGDIDYYIQIKSGPNTMNVGMVTSLNEAIDKIEETKPGSKGILGMTYGTRDRVSNQILANLNSADERMKVGRELWDFLRGKQDYHKELFALLDSSSRGILDESIIELIESKIIELEAVWHSKFAGLSVDQVLEHYI